MMDDAQLLRSYAADRSEAAFAELVRRHLDFVYSAALRQANGDVHLAEDAAQLVFADLARKASALGGRTVLKGWLFTSTRFAVSNLIRRERRRQAREQEAHLMMNQMENDPTAGLDWERVRPVLDEALAGLKAADREAVLLRFFEGRDFAGVGARLQLSENAARMRVDRALGRLQAQLTRRGLTSSTAALAAVLVNQTIVAAPSGLAATVTGSALAGASTGGLGALATFMTMNKLAIGLAGTLLAAGTTGFVVQARTNSELHAELQSLRQESQQIAALKTENLRLARLAAEAEAMRTDDTELAQLNDEAEALKGRLNRAVRLAAENAASREVNDPSKLDRAPRVKTQLRPKFPIGITTVDGTPLTLVHGEVVVDFIVDSTGTVRNAYVARSTQRELEASAIEAVGQWTFEPGQKGGRTVNTHLQVPIVFDRSGGDAGAGTSAPDTGGKKSDAVILTPVTVERKP